MSNKKKIHLVLALILLLQIVLPMLTVIYENCFTIKATAVSKQETTVDGITWTYEIENGKAINVRPKDINSLPAEVTIPSKLGNYTVISLGAEGFINCENLTSVEMLEGLISIGSNTFNGCISLKSIKMPEGLESIRWGAFQSCHSLTSIEIPSGVKNIEKWVFADCTSLENIKVSEGNQNYSSKDGVLFNKNKTSIVTYPEGKKDKKYSIPSEVTSIGNYAFDSCTSLTTIEIPTDLKIIDDCAFFYCCSLILIEIPEGVTHIGDAAIVGCDKLESINVVEGNQNYSSKEGVLFDKNKTKIIAYPEGKEEKKYSIPSGVTSIGDYAFFGCDLTTIELPSGVTSIGDYTFMGCGLTTIELPKGVTNIGFRTFADCHSLKTIEVPEGVTSIGDEAFANCKNLTIICHEGSYTKEYAISNNIPYVVYGNVSGDGKIGIMDILAINKHRLGKSELTGVYLKAADVNGDGKVDLFDILQINKYRLGKIESL